MGCALATGCGHGLQPLYSGTSDPARTVLVVGMWHDHTQCWSIRGSGRLLLEGTIMKEFVDKFLTFFHTVVDFFARADAAVLFTLAVITMLVLRASGLASLAVFLALIYIMWFVSVKNK